MKEFKSRIAYSKATAKTLIDWCSDFRNIIDLLPEQITIPGMADIVLKYLKQGYPGPVILVPEKSPFHFELRLEIAESAREELGNSEFVTILKADLNPMLKMVASRPLQHLVEEINIKLAAIKFSQV